MPIRVTVALVGDRDRVRTRIAAVIESYLRRLPPHSIYVVFEEVAGVAMWRAAWTPYDDHAPRLVLRDAVLEFEWTGLDYPLTLFEAQLEVQIARQLERLAA